VSDESMTYIVIVALKPQTTPAWVRRPEATTNYLIRAWHGWSQEADTAASNDNWVEYEDITAGMDQAEIELSWRGETPWGHQHLTG